MAIWGRGGRGGVRLTNGPPYPPVQCLDHNNRSNIIDLTSTADNTIRLTKLVYSQQIAIGFWTLLDVLLPLNMRDFCQTPEFPTRKLTASQTQEQSQKSPQNLSSLKTSPLNCRPQNTSYQVVPSCQRRCYSLQESHQPPPHPLREGVRLKSFFKTLN